jgi:hypothetical protein
MSDEAESERTRISVGDEDLLEGTLQAARAVVFRYPLASRAFFRALAAEGRAYAQTPVGAARLEELRRSPALLRAQTVFELATANGLNEQSDQLLPSAMVDALLALAAAPDLEDRLERWLDPSSAP